VGGVVGCGFETPAPTDALPKVSFSTSESLTDESVGSAEIRLVLSFPTGDPVTVKYEVSDGTAKASTDLTSGSSGELTIDPFKQTAKLLVGIADDMMEENEETLQLALKSADGAELGDVQKHTLHISATKLPRVRFVADASTAGEQTGPQTFAVQLDKISAEPVLVKYTWTGSSELADHGIVDGVLTIPPNQSSQSLRALINDDNIDEYDETIDLELVGQAGAIVEPGLGEHVHTIVDDDPEPVMSFAPAASTVNEGAGTATLTVSLALPSEKPITVDYAVAPGGTASTDDYTLAAGTLTFAPGTTSQTISVTIANDTLDEDDETLQIALSNATNATLSGTGAVHALTIADNDNPPTLEFQQAASTASEGTATHTINVKLSAPSGRTVQFSLARGGTSSAADLTLPATTFTIAPGATTLAINLTVLDDTEDDDNETAILTLTGPVNATVGPQGTHTVTITDNDGPSVRFDPATADQSAAEQDNQSRTFIYRVILSAPAATQITVPISLGGTASSVDYNIASGDIPVVFPAGTTTKDIRVIVSADRTQEPNDTITLTIGNPTNATKAADNQSRTHTILNDD
jgi:hypothetical protein